MSVPGQKYVLTDPVVVVKPTYNNGEVPSRSLCYNQLLFINVLCSSAKNSVYCYIQYIVSGTAVSGLDCTINIVQHMSSWPGIYKGMGAFHRIVWHVIVEGHCLLLHICCHCITSCVARCTSFIY